MQRTINRLDRVHRRLTEAINEIDQEVLRQRPAANEWSIAEVIQHLSLVEERVLAELEKNVNAPPRKVGILKRLIPMRVVSWRFIRVAAPKVVVPQGAPSPDLLKTYDDLRERLKHFCTQVGPKQLRRVTLRHPLLGDIDGAAAVSMIAFHEQRHYKQIQEVIKQLDGKR